MNAIIHTNNVEFNFDGSLESWSSKVSGDQLALAAKLLENCETLQVSARNAKIQLPQQLVAAWPEKIALAAGLPKNCPFGFDLRLSSGLGHAGTTLSIRWLKPSTTVPLSQAPTVNGLVVEFGTHTFRAQEPYFSVIEMVDQFNQASNSNPEEQFRIWSEIRQALGETVVAGVTDSFLRSLRVTSADSFTLSFETDENGDLQLAPALLTSAGDNLDNSLNKISALTDADQEIFVKRLDSLPSDVSSFPISGGSYVVVSERLQKALSAVRQLRRSSPQERKKAVLHPEAVIAEMIGEDNEDENQHSLFVETANYSDRVLDVAEWVPPIVPWIKVQGQEWIPSDTFGFRVGDTEIALTDDGLSTAIDEVELAIAKGEPTATVDGGKVPATEETLSSLRDLKAAIQARKDNGESPAKSKSSHNVLIIQTNFEDSAFARAVVGSRPGQVCLPDCLKTEPKKHQIDGLTWLQSHWISGSAGALLADDMGLGKTFQALAFVAWLRELMFAGHIEKKPILIVAPVGLLRNWEAEHEMHLMSPGLGDVTRAYGEHIKFLKQGNHKDGSAGLDMSRLSSSDWVLANYEAISDYQLTFGAIKFACVVFDEAQRIKTPSARMTHAAKALNSKFTLAMTGTPVENRLADLWCIADAVQPQALGLLKEFSKKYETVGAEASIAELRHQIWQEEEHIENGSPLMMLRRLKTQKLKGLPAKHEHVIRKEMPLEQANAYNHALAHRQVKGPAGMLGTIQALRAISLHPNLYGSGQVEFQPEKSARFLIALEILDRCHELNEKALIFLESLELQSAEQFPLILKQRYKLETLPLVINGDVGTSVRQDRVDEFQSRKGFDVMILSPKAGGVGITLTAANHVIHLSRWWNPAVEDQCSDRAYRIGQTKDVHIYYPMAIAPTSPESSFDLKLDQLMTRKKQLSQQLLAPPTITKDDYAELMRDISS